MEFFEEGNGRKSSTRLYSFIVLLFFLVFNFFYIVTVGAITMPFVTLDFALLVAIFTPKYLHKILEVKYGGVSAEEPPIEEPYCEDCGETECICNIEIED